MITIETPNYGSVNVGNVMIDTDGTNLVDGIEIKVEGEETIEVAGYRDVEEMTSEEVEKLIEENL